ncbi:MAG TPA: DUF5985 family protein [Burkholderiales bacterium]|nr:DUF5985 family protein [Burkholderiales bacterium]
MNTILAGAIGAAFITASLFFLRFWKSTRDRFFLFFALSFFIEGINRIVLYASIGDNEQSPIYYLIRLVTYGLILAAIIDKNRSGRPRR